MDHQTKILFLILFVFKDFSSSTTSQNSCSDHEITKTLQSALHGIFQALNGTGSGTSFHRENPLNHTFSLNLENETFFCYINDHFEIITDSLNIYSDFMINETHLTDQLYYRYIYGKLKDSNGSVVYKVMWNIKPNITSIKISQSSKNNPNENLSIDVSLNATDRVADLLPYSQRIYDRRNPKKVDRLKKVLESVIIQRAHDALAEHAKNISDILRNNTRTIFVSNHPNFLNDQSQYYFLIPNIPYLCFNLRNLTIKGLTNFASLNKTEEKLDHFDVTLSMKDIRGEMILDYGFGIEKPMQLIFLADDIILSVNLSNHRINLEARNYQVIQARLNVSLTDRQSSTIMKSIETAIASALIPSMKIWRTTDQLPTVCDMQCPLGQVVNEMAKKGDWKTIKQMLNGRVPFNDDQTIEINVPSNPNTCSNQRDVYDYNISFKNLTIKLGSGIPYPEEVQCEFTNNLKMTHRIDAMPIRKVRLNSDNGTGIEINFHANFTSINFLQIESKNSSSNNSCEFQLNNNEDIKIELAPGRNTDVIMKKKIDRTLISMAKERLVQNIKPIVCFPFEICTQTVKMVDDFFQSFIDKVLRKCSLRKN